MKYLFFLVFIFIFVSCGGQEDYTNPVVNRNTIIQSTCNIPEKINKNMEIEEIFSKEKTVTVYFKNVLLPKKSILGIEDSNGIVSFNSSSSVFLLDAGTDYINIRRRVQLSGSPKMCLYDFHFKITNISSGEYTIYLFNDKDKLVYSKDLKLR